MTRFSAVTLDLSRFPAPLAIRGIDFDQLRTASLERLGQLMEQAGLPWDVARLEANPAAIINRAHAWRELLAYAEINDRVRSVLVAFASGSDLDHLAAFYGVARFWWETSPGVEVAESDAAFRRRVLLAPEAFGAAGPIGAYVFHALSADPHVLNVDVWSPEPGHVTVAVQSIEGEGEADADLVEAVRAHLYRDDIKPLTDVVNVRSVENFDYEIDVECFIRPGPDPVAVKTAVEESLAKMASARRTPSRDVPRSAVYAAAHIDAVDRVAVSEPAEDVAMGYGEVGICTAINVTVTVHAG